MASDSIKKRELIEFLNKKAFVPILETPEEKYKTESKKEKLREVQKSTEREKSRFENYPSAQEVKNNYLSDLNSDSANRINKELSRLHLPTLPELKEEFLGLCRILDV
ncbi:MAG TPA: hypothetical protein VHI78_05775 [Bacteroidales bacterium]|jgi:hypothetical protein|nr:hypothetical protein [Bacteroidales bacterium]